MKMETILVNPRVLAIEKPVRFGRSSSPKVPNIMSVWWLMETNYTNPGFFHEPREVYSLNVMSQSIATPSERRKYGKIT